MALFGTIISNSTAAIVARQGYTREEVFSYLSNDWLWLPSTIGIVVNALSCLAGGYVSARRANGTQWLQGVASASLVLFFVAVTYWSPQTQPTLIWQIVFNFAIPPTFTIIGAILRARRT